MARFHFDTDARTGEVTSRPFTAEEEAAADAILNAVPDRVTARQFKMQLENAGLLDAVEAWVGQQTKLVQIAYQNSGTFVRNEPMMQSGFAALGFQSAQIDTFFKAAFAL